MKYASGSLTLIDQRVLPQQEIWLACRDLEAVAVAIENMTVRGAPAIGCAAAFGIALDFQSLPDASPWSVHRPHFEASLARLARTRPTAVNLFYALDRMRALAATFAPAAAVSTLKPQVEALARALFDEDLATCEAIGAHGAAAFPSGNKLRLLTHCNAGALATAGYGTALGVVRALHARGDVEIVYADETRPWLQGARLTAFELKAERIPYKLIADSVAAYLMQQGKIDAVVVGADRIAANGDTANKIGTYGLAVQAKHHDVAFYVAAPRSSFDPKLATGAQIPVEERHPDELRRTGGTLLSPADAPVYNPSFDVTPAALITGIVTERGVLRAPYAEAIAALFAD